MPDVFSNVFEFIAWIFKKSSSIILVLTKSSSLLNLLNSYSKSPMVYKVLLIGNDVAYSIFQVTVFSPKELKLTLNYAISI